MFILEGNRLRLDRPFNHKGLQYPKEWLRLSSQEQRDELGILELPDNTPKEEYEDRKAKLMKRERDEVHRILSETDWYIVRHVETGIEVPPGILAYRLRVREVHQANERSIDLGGRLTPYPTLVIVDGSPND